MSGFTSVSSSVFDCFARVGESSSSLHAFQVNVHKLLKMIVPDEDLGLPENVEDIVTAMIKHNS
jgi:NAD/NADP transhydrogenase alpha subunit